MSRRSKETRPSPTVVTLPNGDNVVTNPDGDLAAAFDAPEAQNPTVPAHVGPYSFAWDAPAGDEALATLLASAADPEADGIPPSPPTPEESVASAALRALAATGVESEEPADLENVMAPEDHPVEAILVAAIALEANGDLCSARDLRHGDRDQSLLLRAASALKGYNASVIPAFWDAVS